MNNYDEDMQEHSITIEQLSGVFETRSFANARELRKYLHGRGMCKVSFGTATTFEVTGRGTNEKDARHITDEDFEWLSVELQFGVRTLVVDSQLL